LTDVHPENQIRIAYAHARARKWRRHSKRNGCSALTRYHTLRDSVAAKRGREYWRSLMSEATRTDIRDYMLQTEVPTNSLRVE
jgi:hypothetical protein